jgi:glutamate synthase (ferredoxin)
MTGGRVVVLGPTGRNFGAGMSGGIAYLFDEAGTQLPRINAQMVEIERVDDAEEAAALKALVQKHAEATGSANAKRILAAWDTSRARFIKVIPKDYKRVLACLKKAHDQGLSGDDAIMAAFEENSHDLSRVGGN